MDSEDDDIEQLKKYHEKAFKVFKQQKMPLIGGGAHHGTNLTPANGNAMMNPSTHTPSH